MECVNVVSSRVLSIKLNDQPDETNVRLNTATVRLNPVVIWRSVLEVALCGNAGVDRLMLLESALCGNPV